MITSDRKLNQWNNNEIVFLPVTYHIPTEASIDGRHIVVSCTLSHNETSTKTHALIYTVATGYEFMDKDFVSAHNIPTLELKNSQNYWSNWWTHHLLRQIHPSGTLYLKNSVTYRACPFLHNKTSVPPCFGNPMAAETQCHPRIQETHNLFQIKVLQGQL